MDFIKPLFLVLIACSVYGQKAALYESIEYKQAYEKETRLRSGLPSENYWQNRSNYEIEAHFDPESRMITGHLKVTYFNESPDSLNSIVFKLMQNLYKKGAVRQIAVDEINIHDGIKIEHVKYNDIEIQEIAINQTGTIMRVSLPSGIQSKSNGSMEMDFETPLPKSSGLRSGTIDSSSFFAAYWFPQIAVYDDIFGWDTDEYVGVPENYNDFSTYDVLLTLPSQYNIWATGEHLNKEEIFSSEVLKRIKKSGLSNEPVMILGESDFRDGDGKNHTWKFKAENVPDFAWGASDHYVWEGMAATNPDPANICWVQTAYPIGAEHFNWVIGVAKNSVEIFSREFPGVPYPYFKHITFRGTDGGGMEFPMLANNNVAHDSTSTIMVTAHELAHNYFPFMMGINERKYGWWDETMTTLMESYLKEKAYPNNKVHGFFNRKMSYNYFSATHDIMPLITETSSMMKVMPTIVNFYVKGPASMDILIDLIGQDKFNAYTRAFMNAWAWKHPTPYDFFYFINRSEGENLNWFWDAWFFNYGYPDLAISGAEQSDQYLKVEISNVGGLPVPFNLILNDDYGNEIDESFGVDIWENNLRKTVVRIPVTAIIKNVTIDDTYSYDANLKNNEFIISE